MIDVNPLIDINPSWIILCLEFRKQRRINWKGHRHEVNESMDSYQ